MASPPASTLSPQQSGCLHWCRSCLVVVQLLFESLVAELLVVVSSVVGLLVVGLLVAESSVPGLGFGSGPRSKG
jgi:hypothetical protein